MRTYCNSLPSCIVPDWTLYIVIATGVPTLYKKYFLVRLSMSWTRTSTMLTFSGIVVFLGILGTVFAGPKRPRQLSRDGPYTNSTATPVSLNILTETGTKNATAPYLYGWMFEDINHSGDGGIYGELLTNRAFDGSTVTWSPLGGFSGSSITWQENMCEAYGKNLACLQSSSN